MKHTQQFGRIKKLFFLEEVHGNFTGKVGLVLCVKSTQDSTSLEESPGLCWARWTKYKQSLGGVGDLKYSGMAEIKDNQQPQEVKVDMWVVPVGQVLNAKLVLNPIANH